MLERTRVAVKRAAQRRESLEIVEHMFSGETFDSAGDGSSPRSAESVSTRSTLVP